MRSIEREREKAKEDREREGERDRDQEILARGGTTLECEEHPGWEPECLVSQMFLQWAVMMIAAL